MIIPSHLQIETSNGVCSARCTMCAFTTWTRKPYCMRMNEFLKILQKFKPYQDKIQFLSLFGFGEPLFDRELPNKIRRAKKMGFKGIGFATNCTELNWRMTGRLLDAGLDTLICSIDGITKETHEAIRVGTDWNDIMANVLSFIITRDFRAAPTKIIIRFIKQAANIHEWPEFKEYWEKRLDPARDAVISYSIVDCERKVPDYETKDVLAGVPVPGICDQLYERMIVLSNGEVALCCADDNSRFKLGNVLEEDPIEIYNNPTFKTYRREMEDGRIDELMLCNSCTIPRSQKLKDKAE